jgi:hypothetical protein
MEDPNKLRALARWYREFSEKTQNPAIWDLRVRHAENLDAEAERIERALTAYSDAIAGEAGGGERPIRLK